MKSTISDFKILSCYYETTVTGDLANNNVLAIFRENAAKLLSRETGKVPIKNQNYD